MSAIFVEDLCSPKGYTDVVGVVQVTHTDVDSHQHLPFEVGIDLVKRNRSITQKDFRDFISTGIPPKDVVLIHWLSNRAPGGAERFELIPTRKLVLLDRSFLVGDVVKRSAQNPISGVVTSVRITCSIRATRADATAWERNAVLDPAVTTLQPRFDLPVYHDIPAEELRPEMFYNEGDIVVYQDWVCRIEEVEDEVFIRLSDGSIVVPEDDEDIQINYQTTTPNSSSRLLPGMMIRTKKSKLRRGRWIFGEYDANVVPIGLVLHTRTVILRIARLCRRLDGQGVSDGALESMELELTTDEFESKDFHIYDRHRRPLNPATAEDGSALNNTFEDLTVSVGVRFRDPQAAAQQHGEIEFVPRSDTSGYDVNAFNVVETKTHVRVLWQDMTFTEHQSIELLPDASIEDENEVWPGEIVVTNERKDGRTNTGHRAPEDWIFQPAKVGVVQSVNAEERIARVRWLPGASILYHDTGELDDFRGRLLLPSSTTGARSQSDPQEDVPIYDIRPAAGINRRRGDFVMILSPNSSEGTANNTDEIDWIGEVIHLNLDGTLTVRLGALTEVRDIRIAPELTTLAYSSDMYDESLGSDDSDDMSDEWTASEEEGDYISESLTQQFRERWIEYANGNIQRADDDNSDVEDEEWETADEDNSGSEDEDMPDLFMADPPNEPSSVKSESADASTAPMISDSTARVSMANMDALIPDHVVGAPANFLILDSPAPASHCYFKDTVQPKGQYLRTIAKEHRILQSSLPAGVFVRTWESRLDLLRLLLIGPIGTPYEFAPFMIDLHLPQDYPASPPSAHFHSWTKGSGPINPNLYENGKICLSLLGTWHATEKGATWNPQSSTLLQVVVSILGLVLVKDPYFNEAGYEVRVGSAESSVASRLYSEKTYFKARGFITHAMKDKPSGLEDVIDWLYSDESERSPRLLHRAITAAEKLVQDSSDADSTSRPQGDNRFEKLSKGAQIMLQRQIVEMKSLDLNKHSATPSIAPASAPASNDTQYVQVDITKLGTLGFNVEDWSLDLPDTAEARSLQQLADALRSTDVPVAFPTETVYGLGADATRSSAVKGIYQAKQRPSDNPLIVHFSSLKQIRDLYQSSTTDPIPQIYHSLISKFWPGPLTIILPIPEPNPLAPEVTAGLNTFGARIPKSLLALALIKLADRPIAAPSANASTKPSPTAAEHVHEDLNGRIQYILDDGPCSVGVESTVVDGTTSPPAILRPGGISIEQIRQCPGWENVTIAYKNVAETGGSDGSSAPRAPGMKYRHYSPKAPVILGEAGQRQPSLKTLMSHMSHTAEDEPSIGIVRTRTWRTTEEQYNRKDYSQVKRKDINNDNNNPANDDDGPRPSVITPDEAFWLGPRLPDHVESCAEAEAREVRLHTPSSSSSSSSGNDDQSLGSRPIPTATEWMLMLRHDTSKTMYIYDIGLGPRTEEIARGIFAALRELDRKGVDVIFVEGIDDGEGELAAAVMNRLRKAAERGL